MPDKDAKFTEATFTGDAWFDMATFTCDAWFGGATFTGEAKFEKATFTGDAKFFGVTFTSGAQFDTAWFDEVTFTGDAWFDMATFTCDAWFGGATFTGEAKFEKATFTGDAKFFGVTFTSGAQFNDAATVELTRAKVSLADETSVERQWPRGWSVSAQLAETETDEGGPWGMLIRVDPDTHHEQTTSDEHPHGPPVPNDKEALREFLAELEGLDVRTVPTPDQPGKEQADAQDVADFVAFRLWKLGDQRGWWLSD